MFETFRDFNSRIDRTDLRVVRPGHSVFLCGGLIASTPSQKNALSLRDYLFRIRKLERAVGAAIVLAESAQQFYRDTNYADLITFEEDIARIVSIVLVISESPGSLAELGAFASEPVIKEALRIIISEDHNAAQSFVRYGPIKKIENRSRSHIGIFPWKCHKKNGNIVKTSISPHYSEIVRFIKDEVNKVPKTQQYQAMGTEKCIFFDILWILSLLDASSPEYIYEAVKIIHPTLQDQRIRDCLYALRVCGWIATFSYSGRDYFYLPINSDPYVYSFLRGRRVRDVAATKLAIATEFRQGAAVSKAVQRRLQEKRSEAK